ncbi:hypothetical protein H310_02567 [Aphanomyces invadans]|uniref:Transposase Tc1-like domain-containing protein n=1 Tax=Aphanomyces invadans TaxID=157072 RepID=A0A024UK84_9STRA|nr:hypothetical protein H310_02567 [Aphanomyces invadans]ETW06272.1 hypothetical protein H310_02567 [Aphanomyces invadans]|eukprot:XP_008864347.1 hypothetical protein H310_02567 [Aphanomyces invadans]
MRSLTRHYNIPKTSIFRHMKAVARLTARSSYVKPYLTEANVQARLKFAMSHLEPSSSENHLFNDMHNYVHIDEKWFYLTKVKKRFLRVTFLAAVARPRYDYSKCQMFDGKISVWPFMSYSRDRFGHVASFVVAKFGVQAEYIKTFFFS